MGNQVLYRKYRPKNFEEIAGHSSFKKIIISELENEKLSHALLFVGQRGTGKTSAARLIAKISNCLDKSSLSKSCDNCKSCKMFDNQNHPDIIEIDAASNNGVDEIRNIKQNINISPLVSNKKIYIIDEVHMLTTSAFNAFLKTLEEPPKFVFFILATTEIHKVPQTILSRCQLYNFNKLSINDITTKLSEICKLEKRNVEEEVLREIFYISEGSMRDALNVLDQLFSVQQKLIGINDMKEIFNVVSKKEKINLLLNIMKNKNEEVINFFNEIDNQGINLKIFILSMINILKEIIEYKIIKNNKTNIILEDKETKLFDNVEINEIVFLCEQFVETFEKLKSSTIGPILLLINMFKKITPISVNKIKEVPLSGDVPLIHNKEPDSKNDYESKLNMNEEVKAQEKQIKPNNTKIVKKIFLKEDFYLRALANSSLEEREKTINILKKIKEDSSLSFLKKCGVLSASDFAIILTNKEGNKVNFDYSKIINNSNFQKDVINVYGKLIAILFIERDDIPLIKIKYELKKDELKNKKFAVEDFYNGKIFDQENDCENKSYEQAVEIFGKVKVE